MPIGERWAAILSNRSGLVLPPIYANPITKKRGRLSAGQLEFSSFGEWKP